MFDKYLVPLVQHPLRHIARVCLRLGISETAVTLIGVLTSLVVLVSLWLQWHALALCFVFVNRLCDGLDGAIARESHRQSASGGFIDIVIDFVFYGSVPLGMALSNPQAFALPSTTVLFFYMLSGVIFMAASSAAATLGMSSQDFASKSLYYSINLIEGAETIVFSVLCCVFPQWYRALAYTMAGLLLLSLPPRVYAHFKVFKSTEGLQSQSRS